MEVDWKQAREARDSSPTTTTTTTNALYWPTFTWAEVLCSKSPVGCGGQPKADSKHPPGEPICKSLAVETQLQPEPLLPPPSLSLLAIVAKATTTTTAAAHNNNNGADSRLQGGLAVVQLSKTNRTEINHSSCSLGEACKESGVDVVLRPELGFSFELRASQQGGRLV